MSEQSEYVDRARTVIMDTLNQELAVVRLELEARVSEHFYVGHASNIDPHHVTTALRELKSDNLIQRVTAPSRGGHQIETIQPANRTNRSTAIDRAAARKRALYAKYTGWAQGTVRHPQGLIGPAGEQAVRSAILAASALQPLAPGFGEVNTVLGVQLSGPVDSAGFLVPQIAGIPQAAVTAIFEVKNIRGWIYPQSPELFQVLSKAVELQTAHPNLPIVPILVCRRAHETTFWMAKQLGFIVIAMERQYAGTAMTDEEVIDVRNGLDFNDLHRGTGPSLRVQERLQGPISQNCAEIAETWRGTSTGLGHYFAALKGKQPSPQRAHLMHQLRAASTKRGDRGGW